MASTAKYGRQKPKVLSPDFTYNKQAAFVFLLSTEAPQCSYDNDHTTRNDQNVSWYCVEVIAQQASVVPFLE